MKKSINLYFKPEDNIKEILDATKKAGYDEFHTGIYNVPGIKLNECIDYARKIGLGCTMIHCSYYEPDLNNFWLDNEIGDKVKNNYIEQIRLCKGLTDNFVVHLNGSFDSINSEIGLQRIRNMLEVCDECDINLCIENLYSDTELGYIFSNIQHDRLKICFDTGHRNFLTPNFDLLADLGQYVSVLHMHDNHGKTDEHKIPFEGTIDWEEFARGISKYPYITLSSELKNYEYNYMLENNMIALTRIDSLVNKYL